MASPLAPLRRGFPSPALLALTTIVILVLTMQTIGIITSPGLDYSYAFAFNYFFANDIHLGTDVLFTYGPWGFLEWPQPQGNNLHYANISFLLVHLSFIFAFLKLASTHTPLSSKKLVANVVIVLIAAHLITAFMYLNLVFVTAMFILLHHQSRSKWFLFFAVIITAMALMVRSLYGLMSAAMVVSYALVLVWEHRSVKPFLGMVLGVCLAVAIAWVLTYRSLEGLGRYFYGILEFSIGNSSAMTLNPENNWWFLTLFAVSLCAIPFSFKNPRISLLFAIFLLPSAAMLKYAFAREGWGLNIFFVYLIFFFAILSVYAERLQAKHIGLMVLALVFFAANMKLAVHSNPYSFVWYKTRHMWEKKTIMSVLHNFVTLSHLKNVLAELSEERLRPQLLSVTARQKIGNSTIDTYPIETTYIAANKLNWRPRPVFQSYIAYTPYLDQLNADFFSSAGAPKFIIWEAPNGDIRDNSIDGRYILSDEPLAMYALLNWYQPFWFEKDKVLLWERSVYRNLADPKPLGELATRWDNWVNVPPLPATGILRAQLHFSRTLLGKLKKLAYKEEEFYVEYWLKNGDKIKHRLVIDNAVSGVWVAPYISNFIRPTKLDVLKIRFSHSPHDFLIDTLKLRWQYIATQESWLESDLRRPEIIGYAELGRPKENGTRWDDANNIIIPGFGLRVLLSKNSHAKRVELSLDNNDEYELVYYKDKIEQGRQSVGPHLVGLGLNVYTLELPPAAQRGGFDSVQVTPLKGDGAYAIGHLLFN